MRLINLILEVVQVTAPIFIIIAIGFFIRRRKVIGEESVNVLNKLAYNVGLPALLFLSITRYKLGQIFNPEIIKIVYTTYAIFIPLIIIISLLIRKEPGTRGALIVSSFRCNMAFIGFPIIFSAYGSLAIAKASLVLAFLTPFNIILSVVIFKLYNRNKDRISIRKVFLSFITDPLILSIILGVVFSYFELTLPSVIYNAIDILSGMAVAIALLSIGASFKMLHMKYYLKMVSIVSFNKLILMPVTAFLLAGYVFKLDNLERDVICMLFATPLAVAAYIMAREHESDHNLVSSSLVFTTIFSALTISGWLFFLKMV